MKLKFDLLKNYPEYINKLKELYWDEWSDSLKTELNIKCFSEFNLSNDIIFYIVLDNNNLVGSIALSPLDLNTNDTCSNLTPWLSYVYILPEYRNKGIASKMIKWFLEKENIRPMYLWCKHSLETFYEQFGFKVIEKRTDISILIID